MTSPMVPWPEYETFCGIARKMPVPDKGIWIEFERARYEAAMQRLRELDLAIDEVLAAYDSKGVLNVHWAMQTLRTAQAEIGPLPNDERAKGAG